MAYGGLDQVNKFYTLGELTAKFGNKLHNNVIKKNETGCNIILLINVNIQELYGECSIDIGVSNIQEMTLCNIIPSIKTAGQYQLSVSIPISCYIKLSVNGKVNIDTLQITVVAMAA